MKVLVWMCSELRLRMLPTMTVGLCPNLAAWMPMKGRVERSSIISSETSRESVSFHFPERSVISVGSRRSTSVAHPVMKRVSRSSE